MKLKIAFCLLLTLLFLPIYGQYKIRGIVSDSVQSLPYSTVMIKDSQGHIVTGAVTDVEGVFEMKAPSGKFLIEISSIGFQDYSKPLTVDKDLDLGQIVLSQSVQALSEVTVSTRRKLLETKVDRMVFKVIKSPITEGKNGLELLKQVPGVSAAHDGLSVVTKSSYKVFIDNKELKLSESEVLVYLQSLKSSEIDRIEVITSPPAKYGSDGDFGVILIKTKKRENQVNANIHGGVSLANKAYYDGGAAVTLKLGKWLISSNGGFVDGTKEPKQRYQIFYPSYYWDENAHRSVTSEMYSFHNQLSYQWSDNIELGASYFISNSEPNTSSLNDIVIKGLDGEVDSTLVTNNNLGGRRRSDIISAYADIQLDSLGKSIHLSFDYLDYDITNRNDYSSVTYVDDIVHFTNKASGNSSFLYSTIKNGQVDVVLPYLWADIDFGSKYSMVSNSNGVDYLSGMASELNESNRYIYDESNFAFYTSFSKRFSRRWNMKVGLRSETTHYKQHSLVSGYSKKKHYTEMFPSFFLKYRSAQGNAFYANYQRRINRPSFRLLDPYRIYTTPYNYSEGNPLLESYFTSIYKVGMAMEHFNASIGYYNITNKYDQVTFVDPQSAVQVVRPENFYDMHKYQLYLNYNYGIGKWYRGSMDVIGAYSETDSKIVDVIPSLTAYSGVVVSNNTIVIPHSGVVLDIAYLYATPSLAGSYKVSSYSQCDFGASVMMWHKKLRFRVNYSDIFKSTAKTYTQEVNGIKQINWDYNDTQRIRFSFSYSLNNRLKQKQREDISREHKDRL